MLLHNMYIHIYVVLSIDDILYILYMCMLFPLHSDVQGEEQML